MDTEIPWPGLTSRNIIWTAFDTGVIPVRWRVYIPKVRLEIATQQGSGLRLFVQCFYGHYSGQHSLRNRSNEVTMFTCSLEWIITAKKCCGASLYDRCLVTSVLL